MPRHVDIGWPDGHVECMEYWVIQMFTGKYTERASVAGKATGMSESAGQQKPMSNFNFLSLV